MKITIGKYNVVETQTLIIPNKEESWIRLKVLDWDIKIKIIIKENSSNKSHQYSWYGEEDYGVIELVNWNQNMGSFSEPINFGTADNGKDVYIMIFNQKVQDVNKLDIQFYEENL